MTDPKRWLDEGGGATFTERELLRVGRDLRMPGTLRRRVWAGLVTGLTAVETVAAAGTALQKGAAAKGAVALLSGTMAKGALVLAVAGGVGLGMASLRSPSEPAVESRVARRAPSLTAPSTAQLSPPAELIALPEPERAPAKEAATTPSPDGVRPRALHAPRPASRPSAPAPTARASDGDTQSVEVSSESRRASRLAEESAAVVAIRKTLLSGEPNEALRMLDRARLRFPDGVLEQEREALAVRALVESGQKDAARKRGEAFLRAYPRSPHAARLRALLGP
jgi:hypothetical protein